MTYEELLHEYSYLKISGGEDIFCEYTVILTDYQFIRELVSQKKIKRQPFWTDIKNNEQMNIFYGGYWYKLLCDGDGTYFVFYPSKKKDREHFEKLSTGMKK